jgi:integrase
LFSNPVSGIFSKEKTGLKGFEPLTCGLRDGVMFSKSDIEQYMSLKCYALSKKSYNWINKILHDFYQFTHGILEKVRLIEYAQHLFMKYPSYSTRHKHFVYIRNFIKYFAQTRDDQQISALLLYFEMPKIRREVKLLTSRIITLEDVNKALLAIKQSSLTDLKRQNYLCTILFLAYSGQRVITACRITVGQFQEALNHNPPMLIVRAEQDKIRLEHYVPLHPVIIPYLTEAIEGKGSDQFLFNYEGLKQYLSRHPVNLIHTKGDLQLKDLRKFFEQKSDEIGFTDANKNFIMSHGVSSINWTSYKQFLPENVYKRYMESWGSQKLIG